MVMRAQPWTTEAALIPPPRRADIVEERFDDELILFDPRSGSTYRLNQTATTVWRGCDGRATTRQIAEQLTQTYDVELEQALDDAEQIVAFFGQSGLFDLPSAP